MKGVLKLLSLSAVCGCGLAKVFGPLDVEGAGKQIYLVGEDWVTSHVEMVGTRGFTLRGGGGVQLAQLPNEDFSDPNIYWQVNLMDKHFSFTVDISNVECGCNAAAHFNDMPGPSAGGGGTWYCDGNHLNDQWCPEYDTLESNKYAVQCTLHVCDGEPGHWTNCDRGGCATNAHNVDPNMFCPEDRCTINTNKPFIVSYHQSKDFANMWMSQDGKTADFFICNDSGVVGKMGQVLDSMVFCASLWGGGGTDMSWLDGVTGCNENCNLDSASVTYTDFNIW